MSKTIVMLDGDGVGPEVSDAAYRVLEKMRLGFEILKPACGEEAVERYGTALPDETKKLCREADAVLFGAAGSASVPILVFLRWEMDNYVNIRPIKYYPGAGTPLRDAEGIDFVILRENSEGLYPWGREGEVSQLAEHWPDWRDSCLGRGFRDYGTGKFAIRIITERGTDRMMNFACEYTRKRKESGYPGKLTCVTKSNVLQESCGLFQRIAEAAVKRYPELTYEHFYIDDMCRRILRYPRDMDVVVTSNMFGDILSDEAAELVGGLGIAGSACIGGETPYFEPVHGSAPKYANQNVINPTAMILSAKMMLDHFAMEEEAKALEQAVADVYREGKSLTQDQGGRATTKEFADAVIGKLP
ncbi:MAG TPA: isocitrate/isopropylmalate dehydrogenase family protein [Thermodesulfobacteriota bacterium]|nr:isocitrate/isopropylmalate dehydrogenase family protein [Thermodesulfobacteriota bacterium]